MVTLNAACALSPGCTKKMDIMYGTLILDVHPFCRYLRWSGYPSACRIDYSCALYEERRKDVEFEVVLFTVYWLLYCVFFNEGHVVRMRRTVLSFLLLLLLSDKGLEVVYNADPILPV